MNLKKIKEKYEILNKIQKIVASKKNITLVNILKLSKEIGFYLDRVNFSKAIIQHLLSKFNNENIALNKNKSLLNKAVTLWVYVTEEEKYNTNSYKRHELAIEQNADLKRDSFILIGQRAMSFGKKHNLNIVFEHQENEVEKLTELLPKLIVKQFISTNITDLNFVINSSKIEQKYIKLLPIKENNFALNYHKNQEFLTQEFAKYRIFQELDDFIESESESYLTYATLSLLTESALVKEKYKLVVQNKTLNELEEKISKQKRIYLRQKRELEIEESSILSKKKDMLHSSASEGK
ncbi:MSC_0622 family F1-like ATPase gamma subunit [Mycoplasmopsis iners]|uniref:MSC_0622 family F1-like ATPase gamma subunit n=1 Tax=Mycoplasmopsis iners TaxID=76630 RepID=UPI0004985B31|nr:F0F1 ATP synthase subunit gamma [Mycoplasmopsis iners]